MFSEYLKHRLNDVTKGQSAQMKLHNDTVQESCYHTWGENYKTLLSPLSDF